MSLYGSGCKMCCKFGMPLRGPTCVSHANSSFNHAILGPWVLWQLLASLDPKGPKISQNYIGIYESS